MIITRLIGGNGNQMFQYSAGFALARRHNTKLLLDINYLLDKSKRYFRHENRDYALGMFNISGTIATNKEIARFIVPRAGNKYLYHIKKRITPENRVFREETLKMPANLLELPSDAYLEGYWQNIMYLDSVANELKDEFRFVNNLPDSCKSIKEQIESSSSVCVIFRRGDFVNHPVLDIVKMEFYLQATKIIISKLSDPVFFVFSDDIKWCMDNFKLEGCEIIFVDQALTGPAGEHYLQLIVTCDHFIIPNSTFAWWGAWLGRNHHKIVIAPRKWFKGQSELRNPVLPEEWIDL